MFSLPPTLRAACHRPASATIALLGELRRGLHSLCHHDPYTAFRRSWQSLAQPVPAAGPATSIRARPIYPHSPLYALGTYQAWTVLLSLPRSVAQALLPAGLEPASQALVAPGQHPILLMFGHHEGVRPNFLHVRGMEYLEFLVAVPFVQWAHPTEPYPGPFAFLPRLYLDQWLPVALGWLYGLAKARARIQADGRTYAVSSYLGNQPLLEGSFTPRGRPGPPTAFPNFAALTGVFELPFVTKIDPGPFLCCFQDFKLDEATVQAAAADVSLIREFLPALPTGAFHLPGLDQAPLGAFRIRVPWKLTPPFRCACLKPAPV